MPLSSPLRLSAAIVATSVALGLGVAGLLIAAGAVPEKPASPVLCQPPALAGTVVDVSVTDMGPMMGGGMMGQPSMVPAGQVSLRVVNAGSLNHEVVVLPLGQAQPVGQRPVGPDGKVDETGSLGEASRTCGADAGEESADPGIAPGASGWTTLNLKPGRYELLGNIAGHYGAGMYTQLNVT